MKRKIRVGGRSSALAVAQSRLVMNAIAAAHPELELELVTLRTTGDVNMKPFAEVSDPSGIKGLFTLELEQALLSGNIDFAVHSLKDVPLKPDPRLPIVAYSRRGDPRDALVLPKKNFSENLSRDTDKKIIIGCSSSRRRLQLVRLFPECEVVPVRGNVQTRLRKLDEGQFDWLVLAAAGLERLGLKDRTARLFSIDEMLPAAGQGILACQGRAGENYDYLDAVRDRDSEDCALAERSFVAALGGGCTLPVAAHAVVDGERLTLTGLYMEEKEKEKGKEEEKIYSRGSLSGPRTQAVELGLELAGRLGPGNTDGGAGKAGQEREREDGSVSVNLKSPDRNDKPGKVWLVGAGPGDAGLFTLRGREVLENAEVVVYDRLVGGGVLAMIPEGAERVNVGKSGGSHPVPQREIEAVLIRYAKQGKRVVRLKGGDPFLFGRGGEEAEALINAEIPFEVVPGVTSAVAVPAWAGIPVTHRDRASSFHAVTAHAKDGGVPALDFDSLARLSTKGTLVFLMGVENAGAVCRRMIEAGLDSGTPAAAIERGTTARQRRVTATLGTLADRLVQEGVRPPALLLVGETAGLNLDWRGGLPLNGLRVAVTRPRERAGRLCRMLRDAGAEVLEFPCITTEILPGPLPVFKNLKINNKKADWLGFTSVTGVEALFAALGREERDIRELAGAKIAAIGPATAEALRSRGLYVDFMPEVYDGRHLALGLAERASTSRGVLLFRAEAGSPEPAEILREQNINFMEVPLYRTRYVKADVPDDLDMAVFTSASTVRGFSACLEGDAERIPGILEKVRAVCIGEQTARAAQETGFRHIVTAAAATLEALVDAAAEKF